MLLAISNLRDIPPLNAKIVHSMGDNQILQKKLQSVDRL